MPATRRDSAPCAKAQRGNDFCRIAGNLTRAGLAAGRRFSSTLRRRDATQDEQRRQKNASRPCDRQLPWTAPVVRRVRVVIRSYAVASHFQSTCGPACAGSLPDNRRSFDALEHGRRPICTNVPGLRRSVTAAASDGRGRSGGRPGGSRALRAPTQVAGQSCHEKQEHVDHRNNR